jgi:hypothetical protein
MKLSVSAMTDKTVTVPLGPAAGSTRCRFRRTRGLAVLKGGKMFMGNIQRGGQKDEG